MKRIVIWVVAVIAAAWLIITLVAGSANSTAVARDWPMGLGSLESVPPRFPNQTRTAAALELERLSGAVGITFDRSAPTQSGPDPFADYVRQQVQRTDRGIDPAPPIPPGVAAIRAHLLSGEPIGWDVEISRLSGAPLPNLVAHMKLSRLLTASALERARTGDAGAWDDLHAQWALSRGLWRRPELVSAMIALAIDRNVVLVAPRMPLPAPAWFGEMRAFDYRKEMLAAMQGEAWVIAAEIAARDDYAGGNWVRRAVQTTILRPYIALSRSDYLAQQRASAVELAKVTACGFDSERFTHERMNAVPWWNHGAKQAMPSVFGAWQRVFRFRAELELAEHALGLRGGQSSECADGNWVVTPTSVKFSKVLPLIGVRANGTPLEITR
jgi:hypothetical protein